ncbi:MAG TPA: HNH endonuclease signature motif containing protein [Acidimicrobiales bacterium]|nr:HNH endonuclease signature motif containing protein [Acidimicrobiales bacterium]
MSVSATGAGRELVADWGEINTKVVEWVLKLADFDREQLYRVDGFHSCVSWLEIMCAMRRSTAFEKVRVAHELERRPVVRAAFAAGELPYAKARIITRLEGLNEERDTKFVADAPDSSTRALETRVRYWNFVNGSTKPDLDDHYGMRLEAGFMDGLGRLVLEGTNDMLARVLAITDAYGDYLLHNRSNELRLRPVDESPRETRPQADNESEPKRPLAAKRLDLLLDLLEEVVLVNEDKIDPERASIGVTIQYEDLIENRRTLVPTDQEVLITGEAVRRLACDAGIHRMVIRGVSEFLDIGRKTRVFTTAQRRAIRARHNFRCCAAGCGRRITQIHHVHWWEEGGVTSIDNGVPLCSYHHHLVHEGGWTISYNPNTGVTRLEGPHGQALETQVDVGRRAA